MNRPSFSAPGSMLDVDGWACKGTLTKSGSLLEASKGTRLRQRKHRNRFVQSSVIILEEWLLANRKFPYASQKDQDELKTRTGLKRSQILSWLANARKRGKVQRSPMEQQSPSVDCSSQFPHTLRHLHPFERWLYSGPDTEVASLSEILKAINNNQSNVWPEARSTGHRPHSADWLYFHECLSNASSMEVRSYAANAKSVCSDEWKDLLDSQTTRVLKRRHRRPNSKPGIGIPSIDSNDGRIFQCTFCTANFKKKHDWERHEKSRHLLLESWTCCSKGSVHVNGATNEITCVFCGQNDPDSGHIHAHGFTQCVARSAQERTFTRKDHLRQHLRLVHNGCSFHPSMEAWKNEKSEVNSRCGFCIKTFDNWKDRASHIAGHFRQGALMSSWVGDWGFEPEVSKSLEHATLPESRSLGKTSNASNAMAGEVIDTAIVERCVTPSVDIAMCNLTTLSPEFDFNDYFESANCADQLEIHQEGHLDGLSYLALESHEIKSSSQFHGAIDVGVNWLIDDRRSETITTSSGDQSQDIERDMDMNVKDWPSCLDLDLLDSETFACLPSNIIPASSPQAPAVLQDKVGL